MGNIQTSHIIDHASLPSLKHEPHPPTRTPHTPVNHNNHESIIKDEDTNNITDSHLW